MYSLNIEHQKTFENVFVVARENSNIIFLM